MKKNTIKTALFIALLSMGGYSVNAQNKELKVGNNPTIKQPSAVLEVESTNKGMLMPRVTLTDIYDTVTIAAPANSLIVFNTASAGATPDNVTPGYYYWSSVDGRWMRLLNQDEALEPWMVQGTTDKASDNTQNIYQMGKVALGRDTARSRATLDVVGSLLGGTHNPDATIGENAIAFGSGAIASGQYSAAFNRGRAEGLHSTAIGFARASGLQSFAIGAQNHASGQEAFASGQNTIASGLIATTFGSYTEATGTASVAFGSGSKATGNFSSSFGSNSLASGRNSVAFGNISIAEGEIAAAHGYDTRALGRTSSTFGEQTRAASRAELAIGSGNAFITAASPTAWENSDPLFQIGNLNTIVGGTRSNAMTVLKDGKVGIGGAHTVKPTENLDVMMGSVRVRDINATAGNTTTDKVVVADANGVLKTVAVSAIAPAETNTALSMTAGQLIYANEQANNANVNLISADADNTLIAGTDGRLFVPEPTAENIYTTNGSLTSNREVDMNGNSLTFQGTDGYLDIEPNGNHMTLSSSDTDRAHFRIKTDNDGDGDGITSSFDIDLFSDNYLQMFAGGEMNGISFGTHVTQNPSPIEFFTSPGGLALGEARMKITGEGNIGIDETSPTEKLDIGIGNVRVREINEVANAGDVSTDKVVVADPDGILKTVDVDALSNNIYNTNNTFTANRTATIPSGQWLNFDGPGNVGIGGVDPIAKLNVNGFIQFGPDSHYGVGKVFDNANGEKYGLTQSTYFPATGDARSSGTRIYASGKSGVQGHISFGKYTSATDYTEWGRFAQNTGNFGINTINGSGSNNPTEKLDVNGNVRVREINTNIGAETNRIVVADANGVLKTIAASTNLSIRTVTANYGTLETDETILVNATAGTVTVTLPATPTIGKKYNVKKIDSTANTVSVNGNGHNIDGTATVSGTLPYQGWVLQYDGTNWFIISRI